MKKEILNKIIKKMASKQNAKSKLNAGELREAANLFVKSVVELSDEEKLAFVGKLTK